jgi:preprotein translocase SecF subunit
VVFVLGIFAVLGQVDALPINVEVDITFIAAILTIVGYTINDTVVVFDRIRERLRDDRHNNDYSGLFNLAINETLSRTIVTSGAVLATSFILLLFAGEVLEGFMLAMIIGIVIGTFSSIFVASPISLDLIRRMMARKGVNIK